MPPDSGSAVPPCPVGAAAPSPARECFFAHSERTAAVNPD
jgi:hypothetical protein